MVPENAVSNELGVPAKGSVASGAASRVTAWGQKADKSATLQGHIVTNGKGAAAYVGSMTRCGRVAVAGVSIVASGHRAGSDRRFGC